MRLSFSEETSELLDMIRGELGKGQELYLVGGAVRDVYLGRKINDLDFAMDGNPTALAKRLARYLDVGFFVLDDERHTARVLYRTSEGDLSPLDFVQFSGGSLEGDLRLRDFTLNAMALSLRDLSNVIDPLNGLADLKAGLLRPCSDHALLDDPVRVLRGIRLALQFDLVFVDALPGQFRTAAAHLQLTSYERQRDEFFKILEGPNPAEGVRFCRKFNVFATLIPPLIEQADIPASPPHKLPLFDHTVAVVESFHLMLEHIQSRSTKPEGSPWWLSVAVSELSNFAGPMESFFSAEVTLGRSKRGLAILGALLHDLGKPLTMKTGEDDRLHYVGHANVGADLAWDAARRLQLSNAEAGWIKTMVRRHMALLPLVNREQPLTREQIYRYYKDTNEVGVAIALLSLADTVATYSNTLSREKWRAAVSITKDLLTAWWKHHAAVVSPTLLLDGNDLQAEFGLKPGKQIGRLLKCLREAQAVGKVTNLKEAKAFIRSRIDQSQ